MKKVLFYPLFLFISVFVLFSCTKDDDPKPTPTYEYFVESELLQTYSSAIINATLQVFSAQYPDLANLQSSLTSDVEVYKITYHTTFNGEKVKASGIVCLPKTAGDYPILSYHNGTNTLHSAAPTANPTNELFTLLQYMSSGGFIIALPDYLGFGESSDMFHPYLHKESTVQTVTDMFRAIKEFVGEKEDIGFNKDVYVTGYSQGAWTTLQVQTALETQYSSEFDIKASACGAGPYNLTAVTQGVLAAPAYPQPYFVGYLFNSFSKLGLTTNITDVFQEPYASRIPTLYNGTLSGSEINAQLTTVTSDLFTAEVITSWATADKYESLRNMLVANSAVAYNTTTPTMLIHGTADTYIPSQVTDLLYGQFMQLGVSPNLVQKVNLDGLSHTEAIVPAGLAAIQWFLQLKTAN